MQIEYILKRSKRRTIGLKIIDNTLVVNAPAFASKLEIEKVLIEHKDWVEKNLNNPKININTDFSKDNYIYIFGKKYQLFVITDSKNDLNVLQEQVFISGKSFASIEKHFREYQKSIIEERVIQIQERCGIQFNRKYRLFKSKWGCCFFKKNEISLNYLLACLPEYCIDEVIYHEITHFKIHSHQKDFYQELEKMCPDYKKSVKEMKKYTL